MNSLFCKINTYQYKNFVKSEKKNNHAFCVQGWLALHRVTHVALQSLPFRYLTNIKQSTTETQNSSFYFKKNLEGYLSEDYFSLGDQAAHLQEIRKKTDFEELINFLKVSFIISI